MGVADFCDDSGEEIFFDFVPVERGDPEIEFLCDV
jgi:hypothetical protein